MTMLQKPNVSSEEAVEIATRLYGLKVVSIKKLVSFDDQNFHIQVEQQHKNPYINKVEADGYTLKITNTAKTAIPNHFESMHAAMNHLSARGIRCPQPIPNVSGKTWSTEEVSILNSEKGLCGIHLLTYIAGGVVAAMPHTKDILFQWGQFMAKIHKAFEGFECKPLKTAHIEWSLELILDLENYLEGFEVDKEALVRRVLKKYQELITPNYNDLSKGMIHGDGNENNILVLETKTGDSSSCIVDGLLDFEDIHYGTYVWDLGVAIAYGMLNCTLIDPLEGAGHMLAGYLSTKTLSNLELKVLKVCIECRLTQSLVKCVESYRKDSSNSYILTSSKTGWTRLAQLDCISNTELLLKWKKIAETYSINITILN